MKTFEKKLLVKAWAAREKTKQFIRDQRGSGEIVSVVGIIIVALIIIAAIFYPNIKSWFTTSVMPGLGDSTEGLFDLT